MRSPGLDTYLRYDVSLNKTLHAPIPRKWRFHPSMTEKLLTETSSLIYIKSSWVKHGIHSQRNFIFSSLQLKWSIMCNVLCPIIIKMTRKSLCAIKFEILIRMRGNTPQGTKMHFPCPARAGSNFFKTIHTSQILHDRPMSVWQYQC